MTGTRTTRPADAAALAASLHGGFARTAARAPDRPALRIAGDTVTYGELDRQARELAAVLTEHTPGGGPPVTAVFAYRTPTAFAGVLGALYRGHAYAALNRRYPAARTRLMLEQTGARAIVVDAESARQLEEVLDGYPERLLLVLPDQDDLTRLARRFPEHVLLGAADIGPTDWAPSPVDPAAIAYLIFTSGSTGAPKAVMVPHAHIRRYVEAMAARWRITEDDRLSQNFDLTFDLSVNDIFVAWERGACICCPPHDRVVIPSDFIREEGLSVWYAVPSVGQIMKRLGMLGPGAYPDLRLVLFCGEPLPATLAEAWQAAAPNATLENVYGPTEVTITCANYTWDPVRSPGECEHGTVPIGRFLLGMTPLVLDERGAEVEPGAIGELFLAGPQVTPGYWRDPERTAAAFVTLPGREGVHYRTGDRVRRPVADGPYTFHGRVDFQVKISGRRVELGEVEAALREATGRDEVVALGWPPTETGFASVVAFVRGASLAEQAVREELARRLPEYMVPREIRALSELPLNVNGKVDRGALTALLEAGP